MKFSLSTLIVVAFCCSAHAAPQMYDPKDCPVVGNTNSVKYHVPGGQHYAKMLRLNQSGNDNRKCFKNEEEAIVAGYVKSKR